MTIFWTTIMSTKLESIGKLQKGSYVVVDGVACKVVETSTSRPGKHGHAKVNLMAVGILDGKKRNLTKPGHDMVDVPLIGKRNATVLSISGDTANVMDSETFETFDMTIEPELKDEIKDGVTILYWDILGTKIMKQIKSD